MGGKKESKKSSKRTSKKDKHPSRAASGSAQSHYHHHHNHHHNNTNDGSGGVLLQRPWATHGQDVVDQLQHPSQDWGWNSATAAGAGYSNGGGDVAMSGYMQQSLTDEPYQAIHSVQTWATDQFSSSSAFTSSSSHRHNDYGHDETAAEQQSETGATCGSRENREK